MNQRWTDVAALDAVPEDDVIGIEAGGRSLALYRVGSDLFATDNICTHGHARLCDGFLDGHEIECPLHQGKFDVRTGKAKCAPLVDDIRTYAVQIVDGRVLVDTGCRAAAPCRWPEPARKLFGRE